MTREIWKPISGYEGLYEVSNKGQIRSIPRLVHYSAGYDRINKGRVLEPVKASRNKNCDYFRVSLSKNNIVRQPRILFLASPDVILLITLTEISITMLRKISNGLLQVETKCMQFIQG